MRQKEKEVGDVLLEKYLEEAKFNGEEITDELRDSLREKAAKEHVTMKDCLHSVRIGFQGFLTNMATGQQMSTPMVLSEPVFNSQNPGFSELRIAEIDKSNGSCMGGDTIWMRCAAKVRRDQIRIRFHEPRTGWESEGTFSPNEVYEQILIIFKTPAYRDPNIRERVHVNLHLYRATDGEYSPPIDFVYLPLDEGPAAKRPRLVPTLGSESFGFMFQPGGHIHGGGGQQQGSSMDHGYESFGGNSNNTEMNPYKPSGYSNSRHNGQNQPINEQTKNEDVEFSLTDLKQIASQPEAAKQLEKILTRLWEAHLQALWLFSSDGDPQSLVSACRQLIGWQNEDGTNALHIAVRNQQPFALKTLLNVLENIPQKPTVINTTNFKRQTPLHQAIRFSDADCVHYLITSGAERSLVDSDGNTAAHYLADTFNEAIYKDVLFPPKDTVAAKQQLDLGLLNNAGQSPVHLAVSRLKMTLLENFIEAQAELNNQDRNSGKTALHIAVDNGDSDMVDLLLENSADVNVQASDGSTPLHLAVQKKHEPIVVKLVRAGANVDLKSAQWDITSDESPDTNIEDGEELRGSVSELISARDLAEGSERLTKLLNGEILDPLLLPAIGISSQNNPNFSNNSDSDDTGLQLSMAIGGARPKKKHYQRITQAEQMEVSPESDLAGPSGFRSSRRVQVEPRQRSPELPTAAMQDDLGSLDFITRLRLSKILDLDNKWEALVRCLGCEDMTDLIKVVCEASTSVESNSPTIVFLDQYEQVPGATVSSLLACLEKIQEPNAVELIMQRHSIHIASARPPEEPENMDADQNMD